MTEHTRTLEDEMREAEESGIGMDHVEKDPLRVVLWRMNHQDRTLEGIKNDLTVVGKTLAEHIAREGTVQESIDEMVSMWKGSKLMGKILTWLVGIGAAIGAAYATAKKGFS